MNNEIQAKINELNEALRKHAPSGMTTFRLFVNCEEVNVETTTRTPDQLKEDGISMRNIAGNWIA